VWRASGRGRPASVPSRQSVPGGALRDRAPPSDRLPGVRRGHTAGLASRGSPDGEPG
jgi:hypothetical protein